jgi:membrane-anchored protein YejM (alkaline phosphatase superfamily)
MSLRSIRVWFSGRASSYAYVVSAVCLNIPILSLVLARHLDGVPYLGLGGVYVLLLVLGYYALALFILVTGVFVVSIVWGRLAVAASGALLVAALFYLALNSVVHGIYRLHVDAFWLEYILGSYQGLGIPLSTTATGLVVLAALAALEWAMFRVARRLPRRERIAIGFVVVAFAALVLSQAIHVFAYHRNDTRITGITHQLPFYYPLTSRTMARRYDELMPLVTQAEVSPPADEFLSLWYPRREVRCPAPAGKRRPNILLIVLESWRSDTMDAVVSPNIHALAQRSSVFLKHFSSGNATPTGIFGLFYGIHPTYWTAVKANSAVIDNPVLIDVLKDHGYAFGIYADSQFGRHKIKDTTFRGIEIHESFAGASPDAKDQDMTAQLVGFMEARDGERRPFFGFAFYKSTHYSYYYPAGAVRFRPFRELNLALPGDRRDLPLYLNHYRNAVSYVDGLVGQIVRRLEASGLLSETIILVTSDHGEEFNDNGTGHWGHQGNFTAYQTQVPLVIYVPWEKPRRVTKVTGHIDVPPTLVQGVLGCGDDVRDYSNGRNLFGPLDEERPLVVGSYVNHALITGDDVYAVYPLYVQKYKLSDIKAGAGAPRADLMHKVIEEMHRFYRASEGRSMAEAVP